MPVRRFLRSIAYLLYGALLASFLAGYAARFVPPEALWWLQLAAIPLPYLSAAVVLGALPVLLARNWALLGLNGALVVLIVIRFWPVGGGGDPSSFTAGEKLSLMTLNYPSWPSHDRARRRTDFLRLVQRERPDVITMQEGWHFYGPDGTRLHSRDDMAMLADSASYLTSGPLRSDRSLTYVPIFSLFPMETVSTFVIAPDRRGTGADVTRAETTWRRRRLVIFNVHLQSFGSAKPWREDNTSILSPRTWIRYLRQYRDAILRRAGQAEQIAAMIEEEPDPVIVMGDFNSTRHNWDFNRISAGLQDTHAVAGLGRGATYHARYPIARIDFILASEEFVVLSSRAPRVRISDHRPVIASVAWREEGLAASAN